jgi:hypothetical protein
MSEHGGHHGGGDTGGGSAGGSDFGGSDFGGSDFGGHHSHGGQAGHFGSFPDGSAQGHHAYHGHGQYGAHSAPGQLNDQWLPYEGIHSPADPAARRRAMALRGRHGPIAGTPGARTAVTVFAVVALGILALFGFILVFFGFTLAAIFA